MIVYVTNNKEPYVDNTLQQWPAGGGDNYLTIVLHFTVRSNPRLILAKHHLIKMST